MEALIVIALPLCRPCHEKVHAHVRHARVPLKSAAHHMFCHQHNATRHQAHQRTLGLYIPPTLSTKPPENVTANSKHTHWTGAPGEQWSG